MTETHKLTQIPYVELDSAQRPDLWPAVGKDLSYTDACEIGNERARQIIAYMRGHEDAHMILQHVQVQQHCVVTIYGEYQTDAIGAFWRTIGVALLD